MTRPRYRGVWSAVVGEKREGYKHLLGKDPFANWERNSMPDDLAERDLDRGLSILYGAGDRDDSRAFLKRSWDVVQRALDEKKTETPGCRSGFPKNRGRLQRAGAYARAVLGEPWNSRLVLAASRDLEEWAKGYSPRKWDAQAQANHLAAVRLALTGGDPARALELLKSRRSYKWHSEEAALLKVVAQTSVDERGALDAETRSRYEAYFDLVRDPAFRADVYTEGEVLRFELAVIAEMYLRGEPEVANWERVIESVAE